MDKLKRLIELKEAHGRGNLNEDDYIGIAQVIDEAIQAEALTLGTNYCHYCGRKLRWEGNHSKVHVQQDTGDGIVFKF